MKKFKTKNYIAVFLVFVLVFSFSTNVFATNNDFFTGSIVSESDIDLSQIEIQVYSSTPVYDETNTSQIAYFTEEYEYSVFTDKSGSFDFIKPSQFCSVSVVLESLPAGYGILRHTQFITPSTSSTELAIAAIADMEVLLVDGEISPKFYDAAGNNLHVDYTLAPAEKQVSISDSMTGPTIKSISNMREIIHEGTVITSYRGYAYSVKEDISDYDIVGKINFLKENGYISEEDRISLYCDLLNGASDYTLSSATTIYNTIANYIANNSTTISTKLSQKLNSVSVLSELPSYTDYYEQTNGTFKVRVYYDKNAGMAQSHAQIVAGEFLLVYNYFVTNNNFNAPIQDSGLNYYPVYITTSEFMSANGLTVFNASSGASKIYIHFDIAKGASKYYKNTIAHEFNHAMMATYYCADSLDWFGEGFSSAMGLVYSGISTDWHEEKVSAYIENCQKSIYDKTVDGFSYGALVFPLYIYKYLGGLSTIRHIYEEYADAGNPYDAISNAQGVSSYQNAFLASATRNYSLTTYYPEYATNKWGEVSVRDISLSGDSTSSGVFPMSSYYHSAASTTNLGTVYFTLETTSSNRAGFMLNKIAKNAAGDLQISTVSTSFTRVVVPQENFGLTIQEIIFVGVNTNYSGKVIGYKITAST